MADSPAYLIINSIINADKAEKLQTYLEKILPIFGANGAKPVGRYQIVEQLIGEGGPAIVGIFEFPSAGAIKQMLASAEFAALSVLRGEIFQRLDLMLAAAP